MLDQYITARLTETSERVRETVERTRITKAAAVETRIEAQHLRAIIALQIVAMKR